MLLKTLVFEDLNNYYKPSLLIGCAHCTWKCCIELGADISLCQNSQLALSPNMEVSAEEIYEEYKKNNITSAIVFGGLEPMVQIKDILEIIQCFRINGCDDDVVIYTGYNKYEIPNEIEKLSKYKNIIVKFGRYIPNQTSHKDDVLGVMLSSDNQYAERIS